MSLDDGSASLIDDIYAGLHDQAAWDRAFRQLVERTRSRFALLPAIDLRNVEFADSIDTGRQQHKRVQ